MILSFKNRAAEAELCQWAEIARSSLHYKAHPGERGMKASTHTPIGDGLVENQLVVDQMRAILTMDYCVYGYQMMTTELRSMDYLINKKKVYRLMKENRLLSGKVIRTQGKRTWVKFRRIQAKRPMEYLCLDIKYVWVHGENRWYYQLAIMDVFSRRILCWIFQSSVRQTDVIALMRYLDLRFGLKGVIIRNDNGSQFIAHAVRQALQQLEAKQEFTHVATPEENAYIEAFHSIEQRELMDRYTFQSFYHAKQHIEKYMHWYNCVRRHGSLGGITPMQKWAQGMSCSPVKQQFEPASVDLSRPDNSAGLKAGSAPYSLDKANETAYLHLTGEQDCRDLVANLFRKNVQLIGG
jgi:putative transposase